MSAQNDRPGPVDFGSLDAKLAADPETGEQYRASRTMARRRHLIERGLRDAEANGVDPVEVIYDYLSGEWEKERPKRSEDGLWMRHRFYALLEDSRPVKVPAPGPWWESGFSDKNSTVVAFLRPGQDVHEWWPEATEITTEGPVPLTFSDRFPEPEWWKELNDD